MNEQLKWIGALAPLVVLFEQELVRQQAASGKTREQVLEEAAELWSKAKSEADDLAALRRDDK